MDEQERYSLTDYPRIFKGLYWGNWKKNHDMNIIQNRNKFVEEFGIKKSKDDLPQYALGDIRDRQSSVYDHTEYYESEHDWIIVLNPYAMCFREGEYEMALEQGYEPYAQLYSATAVTLVKTIPKRRK